MNRVSIGDVIKATTTLTFSFTNTKRGENMSVPGGCTVDLNGNIWGSASGSITVIGGSSQHVFAKSSEEDTGFWLTEYQISTINALCYNLAVTYPHSGRINDGNNRELNNLATSAFENYRA